MFEELKEGREYYLTTAEGEVYAVVAHQTKATWFLHGDQETWVWMLASRGRLFYCPGGTMATGGEGETPVKTADAGITLDALTPVEEAGPEFALAALARELGLWPLALLRFLQDVGVEITEEALAEARKRVEAWQAGREARRAELERLASMGPGPTAPSPDKPDPNIRWVNR